MDCLVLVEISRSCLVMPEAKRKGKKTLENKNRFLFFFFFFLLLFICLNQISRWFSVIGDSQCLKSWLFLGCLTSPSLFVAVALGESPFVGPRKVWSAGGSRSLKGEALLRSP